MVSGVRSARKAFSSGSACLFSLVCLGLGSSCLFAWEDWPAFRGPTGQGLSAEKTLPLRWSTTENVAWKKPIPGRGWSSPVIQAGRVYLTTAVPAGRDQSLRALCLDAGSGKLLWSAEVFRQGAGAPRIHTKNSHASPTPLIAGNRLYVHFGHQGTACLDTDGKVLWKNSTLRYRPVHGNGGSPVLVEDAVVFSCDGAEERFVAALDRDTGKVVWKTERRTEADRFFSFSTPLVITVKGKKQLVSPGSDVATAYDPATGKEIWRVRYSGYSVIPRPVFGHGLLFLGTGFNTPQLLAVRVDGSGDVTDTHVAWTLRRGAPHTPSPLLVGDELYLVADGGLASCLDARTGRAHWQRRIAGTYSASPLHAAGRVYCLAEDGSAVVLRAGKKFEVLARNTLGERTLASPAAADGALFVRTAGHLYRLQERTASSTR
jgi:outer membrane protein assembly factor BamB